MVAALLAWLPWAATGTEGDGFVDFALPSITNRNETIALSAYRGRTVYLDFWSSWCLPCRESLPLLRELQATFSEDEFAVVTVNVDAQPSDGRKLMQAFGIDYPVASDVGWTVARQFGLEQLPAAFLIDTDGAVGMRLPPLDNDSYAQIAAVIGSRVNARTERSQRTRKDR